jgi:hypothetical protein
MTRLSKTLKITFPKSLDGMGYNELLNALAKAFGKVPSDVLDNARFRVDEDDDNNRGYGTVIYIEYVRQETEQEELSRIARESAAEQEQQKEKLRQFNKLQNELIQAGVLKVSPA